MQRVSASTARGSRTARRVRRAYKKATCSTARMRKIVPTPKQTMATMDSGASLVPVESITVAACG